MGFFMMAVTTVVMLVDWKLALLTFTVIPLLLLSVSISKGGFYSTTGISGRTIP